ncbi:MAG: hypothetical protein JXA43_00490 [Candidatus Diapherotrites archaeon]|nr:hypothetical protein [Candidatus Diapherotrites archaeon]
MGRRILPILFVLLLLPLVSGIEIVSHEKTYSLTVDEWNTVSFEIKNTGSQITPVTVNVRNIPTSWGIKTYNYAIDKGETKAVEVEIMPKSPEYAEYLAEIVVTAGNSEEIYSARLKFEATGEDILTITGNLEKTGSEYLITAKITNNSNLPLKVEIGTDLPNDWLTTYSKKTFTLGPEASEDIEITSFSDGTTIEKVNLTAKSGNITSKVEIGYSGAQNGSDGQTGLFTLGMNGVWLGLIFILVIVGIFLYISKKGATGQGF